MTRPLIHPILPPSPATVIRVNRFTVPEGAEEGLTALLRVIARFLLRQDGCRDVRVMGRPGEWLMTIEMVDQDAADTIGRAIAEWSRETGLDRVAVLARLGVTADMTNYGAVPL